MHIDVSWFHRVHEIDLARLGKNSSKWRHFAPTPAKLWPIGAWQANAGIRVVVKGLSAVLWCGKKYIHFRPNLFEAYIHPQPRYHLACIIYGSFQSTNIFQIATRRGKCSPSSNFLVRPAPPPEIVWSLTLDPLQIHANTTKMIQKTWDTTTFSRVLLRNWPSLG